VQQNKGGVQKLFKQFGLFSIAFVLSSSLLNAGSFENFKRSQTQNFKEYKDEKDAKFNSLLNEQWKAYKIQNAAKLYEKPKPKKIPKTSLSNIKKVGPLVNITVPKAIKKQKPIIVVIPKKDVEFSFFGSNLGFNIPDGIKDANFYPSSQKGISNYFDKIATSEYESLINDIQKIKKDMNLNDWGIYLLVNEMSKRVYQDEDNSKLLAWFIFNKLGYAVKAGIANKHVVLLHYSDKKIYSTPNYKFGKDRYYVISNYAKGTIGRMYSYKQNYPGSDKPMDLSMESLPKFVEYTKTKELAFSHDGEEFKVTIEYNQNLLDFMATYPQADYETFFNAPMDNITYEQLAQAIKEHVNGKKMSEALNFILHFVQKSFKYQVDDEQFGHEKVMFAQETLYYDKSDCEDRAVLFSYIVKKIFGIEVVGIKYSDHMTTALNIPLKGDYVQSGRKRFVLADPTYINSNIGESMPKYKPKKPESFIKVEI